MRKYLVVTKKKFTQARKLIAWMEAAPEDFLEDWQIEGIREQISEIFEMPVMSFWTTQKGIGLRPYMEDDTDVTIIVSC